MKTDKFIIGLVLLGIAFTSCKKDDDYVKWSDIYSNGGYVKVNIIGLSQDSISLNESFIAEKYSSYSLDQDASYSKSSGDYSFDFSRYTDNFGSNGISNAFTNNGNNFSVLHFDLQYQKKLDNGKVMDLSIYSSSATSSISNFSFDENSCILKGEYSFIYTSSYHKTITISGDFNLKVTQTYR